MIVVDASVLVTALADDNVDGVRARSRLAQEVLAVPQILDLEVVSVLRRLTQAKKVNPQRAEMALADLIDLPIRRSDHVPLLKRCWQLRENLTTYDAAYVALAEALDVILVTADRRFAEAPGIRCAVEVLGTQ